MDKILETIATFVSGIFAGAAAYITLVEHPARMECGPELAVAEFAPSYRRASVMQASLAAIGFLAATAAWLIGGSALWFVGGLFLGSVIPFTLIAITPTNTELKKPPLDKTRAVYLLRKWGRLHMVRTLLSLLAFLIFLAI